MPSFTNTLEEYPYKTGELGELAKVLLARGVVGILLPSVAGHIGSDEFPWERFSVVRFGHFNNHLKFDAVMPDQVEAALMAYRKIQEKGYSKVGFIIYKNTEKHTRFRAGFLLAQSLDDKKNTIPILELPSFEPWEYSSLSMIGSKNTSLMPFYQILRTAKYTCPNRLSDTRRFRICHNVCGGRQLRHWSTATL